MKNCYLIILCLSICSLGFSQGNSRALNVMENAYVNMSSVNLELNDEFTIMGWMKWDSQEMFGDTWSNVLVTNDSESDDFLYFWINKSSDNNRLEFAMQLEHGNNDMWSDNAMKEGEWFHFAATFSGQQQKLYINGVEKSSKVSTGSAYSFEPEFMLSLSSLAAWDFSNDFNGQVDKISVWRSSLSEEEINALVLNGVQEQTINLISYYSIDEAEQDVFDNDVFKHIALNDDGNTDIKDNDYIPGQHRLGGYYLWQSDVAYQKAHKTDDVFVVYENGVYKMNQWYSFNQQPDEETELWSFVGWYDEISITDTNVIAEENR